mmetsp:Transcript_10195/g.10279  ORF Transcript_10195/g.10279 Transcript_10195/m.10279 type:complete len:122 (-) Transcript_10195:256-621(-)
MCLKCMREGGQFIPGKIRRRMKNASLSPEQCIVSSEETRIISNDEIPISSLSEKDNSSVTDVLHHIKPKSSAHDTSNSATRSSYDLTDFKIDTNKINNDIGQDINIVNLNYGNIDEVNKKM